VVGRPSLSLDGQALTYDADGSFFIAFDRDAGPQAVLVADYGHGPLSRTLAIAPRAWPIEHIDAPFHPPPCPMPICPDPRDEVARIEAARAQQTGAQGWRQSFIWPAQGTDFGAFRRAADLSRHARRLSQRAGHRARRRGDLCGAH
jgi:hypothetical protein